MTRAFLFFVALALTPGPAVAQTVPPSPVIVTQGEAILKRAPDRAWLTVVTETRDTKAADARTNNATFMTAVQAALRNAGVSADAIRTTSFSLTPDMEYSNGRSTLRGYVVQNQIEVRVDDLKRLGEILDAANTPKGAGLSIIGPRFALKEAESVENEALRTAVQNAMTRAESMAAGARRTLGPIVRIEDLNTVRPGPEPMVYRAVMSKAADAVETPVTPGEIEVRARVAVTVEIR